MGTLASYYNFEALNGELMKWVCMLIRFGLREREREREREIF